MNMKKVLQNISLSILLVSPLLAAKTKVEVERERAAERATLERVAREAQAERDAMQEQVAAMTRRLELYQQLAELLAGQVRAADAAYVAPAEMDEAMLRDLLERAQRVQQKRTVGELPGEEEALPRSSVPPAAPRDGEIQSATWTTERQH